MRKSIIPTSDRFENSLPLAAILDEYLATQRDYVGAWVGNGGDHDDGREPTFHYSGGVCLRKDVLKKERAPETPMPGLSLRRFSVGNLIEALMDKAVEWKGISVAKQAKVWRDYAFRAGKGAKEDYTGRNWNQEPRLDLSECLVVGRIDHIVRWQGKLYLLDWKTVHSKKFDYLDYWQDASYCVQLAGYFATFQDMTGVKLDGARLVFLDKDVLRLKQICIDPEFWVPKAWERWRAQRASWEKRRETRELPAELEFKKDKPQWACDPRYCGFSLSKWPSGSNVCPLASAYWTNAANSDNGTGTGISTTELPVSVETKARGNGKPILVNVGG